MADKKKKPHGNLGRVHSEEARKNMSIAHKGMKNRLGKKHTEEAKKKISEHRKKHFRHTKESRDKIKNNRGNSIKALAKPYHLLNPEGVPVTIYNLSQFCREKGLSVHRLNSVYTGSVEKYKGYTQNPMVKFYQGYYQIKYPERYIGDPTKCKFRSSWERTLMIKLDHNPTVLKWGSEPFPIKYVDKYSGTTHSYWVDFIIVFKTNKDPLTVLVEVKPSRETIVPKRRQGKAQQRYLQECRTYIKNQCKWASARKFCQDKGWVFTVMTEKEILKKVK